jgi:hypothetical protein
MVARSQQAGIKVLDQLQHRQIYHKLTGGWLTIQANSLGSPLAVGDGGEERMAVWRAH